MYSASQIIFMAMHNNNPTIHNGNCRLCGGPLMGDYKPYNELNWAKWTSESFNKDNTSLYVCEACQKNRDFRNTTNLKIGKGFIATQNNISFFNTTDDALNALYSLPNPPFVLCFIPYSSKSPLTFYLPVSYSNQSINALIAFNRGRVFATAPVKKGGKWGKVTPVADEIYSVTFNIDDIYDIINFLKANPDSIHSPTFRDHCLFNPIWGLCAWLTGTDKKIYSTVL
ncbi:hypothetical protein V518_0778 [Thermoanaerobacterium aotearoense SCUT27]|uniref:Uncharacterized protein n=4 Tax=Thermoanaerobacterium TaxID=28895 RepID=L0INL4_THETR|nr:hypothetical protein Tsac_2731 [Thermoanaerobacterium saccharolyticum JW/SL-YS485]AGB20453.1 hypothetical protein Thethe_02906 [Thermoanaerobacterium thermosaccharolyticum M0795]ETO39071.1 hypothetical protein V518_0778 [Thermoanaerobacterium aotearoense SCUT27]